MRQGYEVGSWVRSGIYFVDDSQKASAEAALSSYDEALRVAGHDPITTELDPSGPFYYAADGDQQYLHKNPDAVTALWSAPASLARTRVFASGWSE
jgi:peptide-methionine (S)-S-oxide reductase